MKALTTVLIICLISCGKQKSDNTVNIDSFKPKNDVRTPPQRQMMSKKDSLRDLNYEILKSLKSKDYNRFASFIHPKKGVRFSMYGYGRPETDKDFSVEEFLHYMNNSTRFTWGEKDGSGDKLVISLKNYLETWVFKKDYTHSDFYLNEFKGAGNTLNNLQKIYPQAEFTENYIAGSEKYGFMDWIALRLVFEKFEGQYYLVAVVNDQWTV